MDAENISSSLYMDGRTLMEIGEIERAVSLFQASNAEEPHFKTLELQGECLIKLGRFREAIIPLAASTTLNKSVRAPSMLAHVFLELNAYLDAYTLAIVALERSPTNRMALRVKAIAYPHIQDNL